MLLRQTKNPVAGPNVRTLFGELMRKGLIAVTMLGAVLALAAAACGGGGDGGSSTPTAEPTPVPTRARLDAKLLTGVVLQPSDVPGSLFSGTWAPQGSSFTSLFNGDGLRIQCTLAYFESAPLAEAAFTSNRPIIPALSRGAREENYGIPGVDSAFLYRVETPPGLAAWILQDEFMIFFQFAPTDYANPSARALDEAEFARLSGLVVSRLNTLIESPDLVTPVSLPDLATPTP
jgi:hypothetical protein